MESTRRPTGIIIVHENATGPTIQATEQHLPALNMFLAID